MRARLGALGVVLVVAACGAVSGPSPGATPSAVSGTAPPPGTGAPSTGPGESATPAVTPAGTPAAAPSGTPSALPTATLTGHWEATAPMSADRWGAQAVRLGDGSVIVVGGSSNCVLAGFARSQVWDPATGTWTLGPTLNAPRSQFAAAPVGSGGVLVTGGVSAGDPAEYGDGQEHHQSFSSTYTYGPSAAAAGWTRQGLLHQARTLPAAATLPDGRVLVMGGYYLGGSEGLAPGPATAALASYAGPTVASGRDLARVLADIEPPAVVPAYATAEVFDPATGTWERTGAMRYARVGAPAVTLGDGRVLVAGSQFGGGAWSGETWNYTHPGVPDGALSTAELYDPATGRFHLTADLPPIDWAPLAQWGPYPVETQGVEWPGVLVALDDGGALLVGEETAWSIGAVDKDGTIVRTLRFDAGTERWTEIDRVVTETGSEDDEPPTLDEVLVAGHTPSGPVAVRLGDGRVMVIAGQAARLYEESESDTVRLYDPATDGWSALPSLPEPRSGADAVLLDDGSVLLAGGFVPSAASGGDSGSSDDEEDCECCDGPDVPGSAVRFVPDP
jgi:hypothetical protein